MTIEFSYQVCQQEAEYLKVDAKGVAGVKDIEFMYQGVCEIAKDHSCAKILMNAKGLELEFQMTDFVPLMQKLSTRLSTFKIARVCDVYGIKQDLIENMSMKTKLNLKNFSNETDAKQWLLNQ